MGRTSDAKEKLLEAAIELVWSSSYGSVSVDLICERAGVKKGSFYHFFPSKIDLAIEAYETHWRRDVQPIFDAVFAPDIAPIERFKRWCDAIYDEQKSHFQALGHVPGCPLSSLGGEMGTQNERLRCKSEELLARGMVHIERTLRDGTRDGTWHVADVAAKARTISALCLGVMLQAKLQNDPEVVRELWSHLRSLLALPVPT